MSNIHTLVCEFSPCHLLAKGLISLSLFSHLQNEAQTACWPQGLGEGGSQAPASRKASVSGTGLGCTDVCSVRWSYYYYYQPGEKAGKAMNSGIGGPLGMDSALPSFPQLTLTVPSNREPLLSPLYRGGWTETQRTTQPPADTKKRSWI